jgi:hypothetical protein
MDYLFILYILLAITISLGGMVVLIKSDRTFGGFIFIIGAILVFTFYGLRWFEGDALKNTRYSSTAWPPVVNTCPDFLTLHKRTVGGKSQRVCVDLVGVSNSGLKRFVDPVNLENENYIFNLYDDKTGSERIAAVCQECKNKRVTWEGVYDGVSCTAQSLPNANGGSDTDSSGKCK